VHSGKVALLGGMLVTSSVVAVATYSTGSSAAVVIASEHWVSTSRAAVIASKIEGTAFAMASVAGSFVVA
jgi:hypothetical protein